MSVELWSSRRVASFIDRIDSLFAIYCHRVAFERHLIHVHGHIRKIHRGVRALLRVSPRARRIETHALLVDRSELAHNLIVNTHFFHHYFSELDILLLLSISLHKVLVHCKLQIILKAGPGQALVAAGYTQLLPFSILGKQALNVIVKLLLRAIELALIAIMHRLSLNARRDQVPAGRLDTIVRNEQQLQKLDDCHGQVVKNSRPKHTPI